MIAADLEALTQAAGDVCTLVMLAGELADEADSASDLGAVHRVAVLLRALQPQARALHGKADALWMAQHADEQRQKGQEAA